MNSFAKKTTSLIYIYLVISAPEINAARVKQHFNAAHANTVNARQDSGQSQELAQEMEEAMLEIDQIKSEHLFADMGQTSYWGESWATCSDRKEDFMRRQQKLEARYDKGVENGELSAMETGRIALKAYSVASTLSTASKAGCEWVTNESVDSSSIRNIMTKTMKQNKCLDAAKEYVEKARVDNVNPDEAKANMVKIMLSVDCKLPTEITEDAPKSFKELAAREEKAENGALREIQQFRASLNAGRQTSLVESAQSQQVITEAITIFLFAASVLFMHFLVCIVAASVIATMLTMIFLLLKAVFKVALGYSSTTDFQAEMGLIMKPFLTLVATGCTAWYAFASGVLGSIFMGMGVAAEPVALYIGFGVAGTTATVGTLTAASQISEAMANETETQIKSRRMRMGKGQ